MCGIVTQAKQPRHHESPYCEAVENQLACNKAYPSDQRSLVAAFGDDFQVPSHAQSGMPPL
jgi:hypothetical protein